MVFKMNDKLSLEKVNLNHLYSLNLFKISGHFTISDRQDALNIEQVSRLSRFDLRKISVSTLNIVNQNFSLNLKLMESEEQTNEKDSEFMKKMGELNHQFLVAGVRSISYTINNGTNEEEVKKFELSDEQLAVVKFMISKCTSLTSFQVTIDELDTKVIGKVL